MNCKPDQLCRVVRGPNAQAIVRTLHRCKCLTDILLGPMWTCEALQHLDPSEFTPPDGFEGQRVPPGAEICFADEDLKPLGDEGPEDKTVPEELKKPREGRRIIPLVWNPEGEKV